MAFTNDIKDEICSLKKNNIENISELSAFVRNNGTIKDNKLVITTENSKVARRVYSLFKELYDTYPNDHDNINDVRAEVYNMIIQRICGWFNLQYEPEEGVDLYTIAYYLYDFFDA